MEGYVSELWIGLIDRFRLIYLTKLEFWRLLASILCESECGESYAISFPWGLKANASYSRQDFPLYTVSNQGHHVWAGKTF